MKKYQLKTDFKTQGTKIDYKDELNAEQYEVITNAKGPCLVLAGAGSGKTRTLVYLTAFLLEQGIEPQNLMLVTFTNKASREMLNRVGVLLKYQPTKLWGGTFHHLANIILRRYAKHLGYNNNFAILDNDDAKSLLKSCLGEMQIDTKKKYFPKPDLIHSIISFKQNSVVPFLELIPEKYSYLETSGFSGTIQKIFDYYQEKKRRLNAMDFDDLLVNWHRLLSEKPELAKKLSAQFRYILVDEYQDTNKIQGEIVEMLAQTHKNIVVVGDDAQSIYSFRAATINNILEFPKKFPEAKIFKLETNYRSTPEILNLANDSIKHNKARFKKNLHSVKKSYTKPALVPLADAYQQASFICQRILELQEEGVSLNKIAVLFRSTFQALELELELNKRNIPYEIRGGIRFFEQAHIKDVIAYLKIFANNQDELAWKRALCLYPGIGPSTAERIWQQVRQFSSVKEVIKGQFSISEKVDRGFGAVAKIFEKLIPVEQDFIATAIKIILESGYKKYLQSTFENSRDRLDDLEQLANFAVNFKDLDMFLSEIALSESFKGITETAEPDAPKESLILTTIHQAKGLEWKVVFVIGLADGQFPHYKVFERPKELEEERRLFYVATTRAEDELYLTYPIFSFSFRTGQNINHHSTFIEELDHNLFEQWEVDGEQQLPTITYDEDGQDDRPGILKMMDRI